MPIENFHFPGLTTGTVSPIRLSPELEDGAEAPSNSEVRKIAEDVASALCYSLTAVAANPDQTLRAGAIEGEFRGFLKSLPKARMENINARAKSLVEAPAEVRTTMFGRAGLRSAEEHLGAGGGFQRYAEGLPRLQIDSKLLGVRPPRLNAPLAALRDTPEGLLIPRDALPAGDLGAIRDGFEEARTAAMEDGVANHERLAEIYGDMSDNDVLAQEEGLGDGFEEAATTDKMGLWITEVRCVDETNPEFFGDDEIALAGVSVDEDGDTKKISERRIGNSFDDNESRHYNPHWRYTWFSMREGKYWPKRYSVSFALAEKDHGGLNSFLDAVWRHVRDRVKAAIAEAVAGAASSLLGPVIARFVGQAVAWVVDKLVGWIIGWFGDDIFPVKTVSVTTPSMGARWTYPNGTWGNRSSGLRHVHFYGHGGHYRLTYYWKFFS